jgi:hypothetical protein
MSQTESGAGDKRTWAFVAVINFPLQLITPFSFHEPFPQSLKFDSRIPSNAKVEINGMSVSLKPWPRTTLPQESLGDLNEAAALIISTEESTVENAQRRIEPILDFVLDFLSFQLQSGIRIVSLGAIDITPPIAEGMERDYLEFPMPKGFPSPKALSSDSLDSIVTNVYPDLNLCTKSYSSHGLSALRWYVKAIASPLIVDRFIFLWVALEILRSAKGISVKTPYTANCGHEIPVCPICKQPTSREEMGKSLKMFLTENLGVNESNANELWRLRQMLHGSNDLSFNEVTKLIDMSLVLREAVNNAIKQELGLPQEAPPFILSNRPSILTHFGLGGTRKIDSVDLMLI